MAPLSHTDTPVSVPANCVNQSESHAPIHKLQLLQILLATFVNH